MKIVRAAPADLERIRRLIHTARYRYTDYGVEDLPSLLDKAVCLIGLEGEALWGFAGVQVEARPVTLPAPAPTRAYLRGLALRAGYAPQTHLPPLFAALESELRQRRQALQIITYGGDPWMARALSEAGFAVLDEVQFFELDRLRRRGPALPVPAQPARLQPARAADLAALAEVDAAAFPPLWHFGYEDMLELLLRSRMQIAWHDSRPIGYSALIANSGAETQLARLAVHPAVQKQGIGRQLLYDAVRYAVEAGYETLALNTQTDNLRSQRLYRSFGFQPIASPIAVLGRELA